MPGFSYPSYLLASLFRIWAFLPGPREWILVALVVAACYGRSAMTRPMRVLAPRVRVTRMVERNQSVILHWIVDRWVLVFALLTGAVVLAWVATSAFVVRWSVSH